MIIRTESEADLEGIFQVHYAAFGNRNDEARLVESVRQSEGFVSELSLVAECGGEICGHLLLSKAQIVEENKNHEVLALAPIAVRPESLFRSIVVCCYIRNESLFVRGFVTMKHAVQKTCQS
ncbi:GNAT family N-acetyltransferase [Paenibacillus sp. GXUN7292]|uniref:GNAT family N-acetyltransferase n=1 Tax=Paenibacillus sp. GXUN7292 TaxID=3422499 RepID=UPI003D7EEE11